MTPRRLLAATGFLAALALAGCTSAPDTAPSVAASATATDAPVAEAAPSATPTTEPITPTCDNIIPTSTVEDFKSLGWTSQEEPFRIGATALDGSVDDFTALGDTVNTTARLASAAGPGEVLVSNAAAEAAHLAVDREEHRVLGIRGRTEPIEVVVLRVARPVPAAD